MANQGLPIEQLTADDLKDVNLLKLNRILSMLQQQINSLQGIGGTIHLQANLDMQGHEITNVGTTNRTL